MSRQVNFFTDPADARELRSALVAAFPGLTVMGANEEFGGRMELISAEEALSGARSGKVYLVPGWGRGRLELQPLGGGRVWLDERASPVIEYRPSVLDEAANTVSSGRLYWPYHGELVADEKRQIDRMFRWVRTHSVPTARDRRFRVFEHAARNRRTLDFGFGIKDPAPPWPD